MPTAIAVTSADLVLPPTDHQTPTAALLQAPDAQPLGAALADMSVLLEQHGYVIALYPASIPVAHERRLHTVRSVLESNRIALLKVDLPPLGIAVLVRQLRQLSICDFSAGVVASAARLLSHYIYAGALLSSVTKLDRVPVSLKSHAKSWVPGSQFGVLANPSPQLIKIGSGRLAGPDFATQLVVAKGQLQSEWVTSALAPEWQAQSLQETALPSDSPRWWGTGKLIEFAAFLPDISVLYQLVSSVRREGCTWCGIELIGDRCGFCSATLAAAENQSQDPGVLKHGTPTYQGS
ncbi:MULTISPECIES: hypothetical protein [unclassified Streptomyces]|uniref:hypothetical protein n=1 Tax=unclassified Streptomyces TaxID=2593676 RepID=UPI002DD9C157|nr:hypothetical protein [Streptomyces sp. NBC_01750]WSB00600.1 hypothetical protein OIE54_15590 [Streptomyces sp. NBC_01794]WSD35045.1 hypothetical protein OG966_26025 [Streptomyces sp. NBC_01750]